MTPYLIGAGGWAYFQVPGMHPLVAYSRAFDFVEVNSTFYKIPSRKTVESWRRMVPPGFEFTVRCNRKATHKCRFESNPDTHDVFKRMVGICKTLKTEIMHLQTPPSFQPTKTNIELIHSFLSSADLQGVRLALEMRGRGPSPPSGLTTMMEDYDMIHCVDLSKSEQPAFKSDILYSRLFGKGAHNIYEPTDEELARIHKEVSEGDYRRAFMSFHFIKMYKDATRLKVYKETGSFPKVTRSTGLGSLQEVLREDAKFPSSKKELIRRQGWKLIDLKEDRRVHASHVLKRLPERVYYSIEDVTQTLTSIGSR